jgi:O-antigen/teichoic acid export membrane protein
VSETQRIFRNTAAQSAPVVTTFLFSFILAPIMLSRLGLAQFGVWAVTGALAQYARLLDFGITNSMARFVALFDARGDRRAIEETIGIGAVAATAITMLTIVAAILAAPLVAEVLGVLNAEEMRVVLLCSGGISASYLFSAVVTAVPVGLRRMGPPNVAQTAGNVVNFIASLAALALSTRLEPYALANLGAAVVGFLITVGAFVYVWSAPFLRRPPVSRVREILGFGVKSQLVILAQLVNAQTDKLIIAAMLGPRTAGAYEIGNRVVQGTLSLGVLTLSALIPAATADIVQRGKGVIAEYLERYTVRSLAIAFPLFGMICVSAPYLLIAWLGQTPPDAVQIIALLSVSYAISMTTGVAMTLVVSDGAPGLVAQTATLVVLVNVGATLIAAPLFGLWGVLVATAGAEVLASTVFLIRFHRRYALSMGPFLEAVGAPAAVAVAMAAPFALWYLLGGSPSGGRLLAFVGVVCTGGLYAVGCWLVESGRQLLPEKLRVGPIRRRVFG